LDQHIRDQVDLVIDAGKLPGGEGSTVVDVTVNPPKIIREGAIEAEKIERVLKG
jgi:L-threonylcarbamoyladenylate synthase